ncbi:hypothetical protein ACFE04_009800 [Oxalis oulophora]
MEDMQEDVFDVTVIWRGKNYVVGINLDAPLKELAHELQKLTNVKEDTIRLIVPRSSKLLSPFSDEHSSLSLREASITEGKSIRMMGVTENEAEEVQKNAKADLRIAGFDEEEKRMRHRTSYRPQTSLKFPQGTYVFCDFRTLQLPGVELNPPASEALKRMHMLASDPGIVAIMNKHRWRVGIMTEMAPVGYVGVSPKCLLGFNKNQGEEISLRLRTDDLKGFRKYQSIKKTLLHELAHMVYTEHDGDFYALDKQLNQEAASLDWTKSKGHTLSKVRHSENYEEDIDFEERKSFSQKLGGNTSNMLNNARASSVIAAYRRLAQESTNSSEASKLHEEPDPDDSWDNMHAEPDPDDSQEIMHAEPDPDDSQEIMHAEPDPDDSPDIMHAEPDPDDSLDNLHAEPDPDDSSDMHAEPDPDDSLDNLHAEPDPDDSPEIMHAEPDPDDSLDNSHAEPDPDDSLDNMQTEPDPDDSGITNGVKLPKRNTMEPDPDDPEAKQGDSERGGILKPNESDSTKVGPMEDSQFKRSYKEPVPDESENHRVHRVEPDPDDMNEPDPDDEELRRIQDSVTVTIGRLQKAIQMLQVEAGPKEVTMAVLQTLFKIISNVISRPNDVKFKRLRKANPTIQRTILNYKAAMEILVLVGFNEDMVDAESYLVLKRNDPGLLWLAKSSLEACMAC